MTSDSNITFHGKKREPMPMKNAIISTPLGKNHHPIEGPKLKQIMSKNRYFRPQLINKTDLSQNIMIVDSKENAMMKNYFSPSPSY
jgi:hypothetical protein